MEVNRYFKRKWRNEYGVYAKRVRIWYNPFNYWGVIPESMYVLYEIDSHGFKCLITKEVFTSVESIEDFLKGRFGR